MSHPYYHAISSSKKFGGVPEDYQDLHDFFDSSKASFPHWKHRALYHHSEGIFLVEKIFGTTIINSDRKRIPVRLIGEQHVMEDLGWIPSMKDWLTYIGKPEAPEWMFRGVKKEISKLQEEK